MDLLPLLSSATNTTILFLTVAQFTNHLSLQLPVILAIFTWAGELHLLLTQFSLSAITCVLAWYISNQMLCKCQCHHANIKSIYLYRINWVHVSWNPFWSSSFCLQKPGSIFSCLSAAVMGRYKHHMHILEWGEKERPPTHAWKNGLLLQDHEVWKEEVVLRKFTKHLPHH